jgi:hypothetical protein
VVSGTATCTLIYRTTGSHTITAEYSGDGDFNGATAVGKIIILPVRILGKVTAQMRWSFYYTPTYTNVLTLLVTGASPSASVTVTCQGKGCPYARRSITVPKRMRCGAKGKALCPTSSVDVAIGFRKRRLAVGAKVTVVVSRPSYIAKYYAFTIRARQGPSAVVSCVAPGRTQPGVGCS